MLECNIDARGKAARFLGGLAGVVFGLVAAILLATGVVTIPMGWYMVGASVFGGAFAVPAYCDELVLWSASLCFLNS